MSKNIVICCDGTGNEFCEDNSNVVHLFQALLLEDARQVSYYHPGVGTMGSPTARNRVEEWFSVVAGLAFGAGILDYVGDAYRFLMDNYEDGDRVYLFGFSRGAYTARALSGMVYMFGLLHAGNEGLIPYILKMFARKTRRAGGMKPELAIDDEFKATFSRTVSLHMVGVWDTVSSVGFLWDPLKLPYTARNPIIVNGRHAVSIDERRCMFRNNLWGAPLEGQTIKQVWFAGVHSDIGGSYTPMESGLSQITMRWMLDEAMGLGLLVNGGHVRKVLGEVPPPPPVAPNPAQRIHKSLTGLWWLLELVPQRVYNPATKKKQWRIPLGASRVIPLGSVVHASVARKIEVDRTYRPKNLPQGWQDCVEPEVEGWMV